MSRASILQTVGGVLVIVAAVWGVTGFYAKDMPVLLGLLFVGGGMLAASTKIKDRRNR